MQSIIKTIKMTYDKAKQGDQDTEVEQTIKGRALKGKKNTDTNWNKGTVRYDRHKGEMRRSFLFFLLTIYHYYISKKHIRLLGENGCVFHFVLSRYIIYNISTSL